MRTGLPHSQRTIILLHVILMRSVVPSVNSFLLTPAFKCCCLKQTEKELHVSYCRHNVIFNSLNVVMDRKFSFHILHPCSMQKSMDCVVSDTVSRKLFLFLYTPYGLSYVSKFVIIMLFIILSD